MQINEVDVIEFKNQLEARQNGVLFLDVRTHEERQEEFIEGTTHIPLAEFPLKIDSILQDSSIKKIYIQCLGGARSANVCTIFLQAGFNDVYNVKGGLKAWKALGFKTKVK